MNGVIVLEDERTMGILTQLCLSVTRWATKGICGWGCTVAH